MEGTDVFPVEAPPPNAFGDLLRRLRQRAGLTQEELAERASLSVRAISDLERGARTRPWRDTVALLADALGLSAAERAQLEAHIQRRRGAYQATGAAGSLLPEPPTPLIGRQRDVAEAAHRLRWGGVRLLTITGPGGVGKTRVAIAVARELQRDTADGAAFVPLAALQDSRLVAGAVLRALGVKETSDTWDASQLLSFLRERDQLLVLDNFEHLTAAAGLVSRLLQECPQIKLLVTSRSALKIQAEHRFELDTLEVPGRESLVNLDKAARYPAVELFVQRAQAVKRGFELTGANLQPVVEICRRLDGLPLALELAATWIGVLPPHALLMRLDERLRLLAESGSDRPDRQRTMRDAIAWSYALLSREEQELFCRLGVFVGGCSAEAAEVVCNPGGELDLLPALASLIEKSLLRQEGAEEPRFGMLETIREFAQEELRASGDMAAMRDGHLAYFETLVAEAEPHLTGAEHGVWLARLEAERANLLAALQWAHEAGRIDPGLRLATGLLLFWEEHGPLREGRYWLERFLDEGGTVQGDPVLRSVALRMLGRLSWLLGDLERAEELFRLALALAARDDDPETVARLLNHLAGVTMDSGDLEGALELYQEALTLATAASDRWQVAAIYTNLGNVAAELGQLEQATSWLQLGLEILREFGDGRTVGMNLNVLGEVFRVQGLVDRAEATFREALRLLYDVTDSVNLGYSLDCLARVARDQQSMVRAARLLGAAARIAQENGTPLTEAVRLVHEGVLTDCERALGAAGAATARAEGAAMSLDEVVAYALGEEPIDLAAIEDM